MGQRQHTLPVEQRFGSRTCLRKGCERVFQAVRWNQRYCREPNCLRQVHRWQATKRQRAHRRSPANRKRHAEAERNRRRQSNSRSASVSSPMTADNDSAWSRSKANSRDFCDRPGCYEPLPSSTRAPARYCDRNCRQAVRRVVDRERKWLMRHRYTQLDQQNWAVPTTSSEPAQQPSTIATATTKSATDPVGDYRAGLPPRLSSSRFESPPPGSETQDEHSQTHPGRRSRPPPTG